MCSQLALIQWNYFQPEPSHSTLICSNKLQFQFYGTFQYHNVGFTLSLEKSTKILNLRIFLSGREKSPEMVQLASWPHNLYKRKTKHIYCVCVNTHVHVFFFSLSFFSATSSPLNTTCLGLWLWIDISMDFSIAGCVKGDRLFVFPLEKNWNRLFLSKVGRDLWQRGPAHLYRQVCCRLPQIDHQLGSNSFRCRFTMTLAVGCSADRPRQIDVQFSERRSWLHTTWGS